jgi:anti-sigma factor RsiW
VADPGSHARHDRFAIADAIGGGVLPSTLATCPACRALHIDLVTLQLAVRAAWSPRRERDLRLTTADAIRLQRGRWRWLVGAIGTPRDVLTRPLALSFTGLGLAGLLLTTVPTGLSMGASGAAPAAEYHTMITAETPSPRAGTDIGQAPVPADPLPGLSIGLLAVGAALFATRHMARRVNGVP